MKLLVASFAILSLLAGTALGKCTNKNFESLDQFDKEFGRFVSGKGAAEELAREAAALEQNEEDICEENSDPNATEEEKLYDFDALTDDEFQAEKTGAKVDLGDVSYRSFGLITPDEEEMRSVDAEMRQSHPNFYDELEDKALPESYDSRAHNLVTEPKNQLSCGSCAAFSAGSNIESCILKKGGKLKGFDLAEQYLINCGYDGRSANGCNGAAPHAYQKFGAANGGEFPHEFTLPYEDNSPTLKCTNAKPWYNGAKQTSYFYESNANEEKIKKIVYNYGSASVAIYAGDKHFKNYKDGIVTRCSKSQGINHAVTIVGWGSERGIPYWIVKNSWGKSWGEGGYVRMMRGVNLCKIESLAVTAICDEMSPKRYDAPLPTPPKVDPPPSQFCDLKKVIGNQSSAPNSFFHLKINGHESEITCQSGVCTPKSPGPSNACVYICGKVKC